MAAPQISFSANTNQISLSGTCTVNLTADRDVSEFEVRACAYESTTYGVGVGTLIGTLAAFSAGVQQTITLNGSAFTAEARYKIYLWAKSLETGTWNDDCLFIPSDNTNFYSADGKHFLCVRSA